MKSMTGYGRSLRSRGGTKPEASIRTVNGRFLEVRIHMPREWGEIESEIRSLVQTEVARGTVDVSVNRVRSGGARTRVRLNRDLAKEWKRTLQELAKTLALGGEIPLELVARAPDVIQTEIDDQLTAAEQKAILASVREALSALGREREREGAAIRTELKSLLGQLHATVAQVEKLAEASPEDLRARLRARLDRLGATGLATPAADDSRFQHEVALLIDRGDIREEIARLTAHLKVYSELVAGPKKRGGAEPIGKRLDFYAQELLREVNTVGSKSQNADLTRVVVEAKTLVEKIREQVQNVE